MIDLATETVFPLKEANAHANLAHKPSLSAWYRWADNRRGSRGVILETIMVGGALCTSLSAIQRFCEGVSAARAMGKRPSGRKAARAEEAAAR